jgi:molybdopterin converting factor small subunit
VEERPHPADRRPETMREIVVEMHAQARELAGDREARIPVDATATCADLKREIAARYPGLAGLLPSSAIATDDEYLADTAGLGAAARFHLIPPVSGG